MLLLLRSQIDMQHALGKPNAVTQPLRDCSTASFLGKGCRFFCPTHLAVSFVGTISSENVAPAGNDMGAMVSNQGTHLHVCLSNLKSYTDCIDKAPLGPVVLSGICATVRIGRLLGTNAS